MKSAAFSPMYLTQSSHKDTTNMVLGGVKVKDRKQLFLFLGSIYVHAALGSLIWASHRINAKCLEMELEIPH